MYSLRTTTSIVALAGACTIAGCASLPRAIERGDTAAATHKIFKTKDLDRRYRRHDGNTALIVAISEDDVEIVDALLTCGANPDRTTADGITPLELAAARGRVDIVRSLLDAGADIEGRSNGYTPLCSSARNGNTEVVAALVEAGANLDAGSGSDDLTPLACAATAEEGTATLEALLLAGADLEDGERNTGRTPLMRAVSCAVRSSDSHQGCRQNAAFLLEQGANADAADDDDTKVMDHALPSRGYGDENENEAERTEDMIQLLARYGAWPTSSVMEWVVKRETRQVFFAAAPAILACFHPSQSIISASMTGYDSSGSDRGTAEGYIRMSGLMDSYAMEITLHYDKSESAIRVQPGRENTWAGANPSCALRDWTPLHELGSAADQARVKLSHDIALVAAAVSAVAFDSKINECVAELAVDEALGSIDDHAARIAATAAWRSVKRQRGSEIARDVAVSEVMRVLEQEEPEIATALKAVGFAMCLGK